MPGCVYFRRPASPLLNDMVIAYDIMQPIRESASPDMPLYEALELLKTTTHSEGLPVVENGILIGMINRQGINNALATEIIKRRED